jgi:hypothetical protein
LFDNSFSGVVGGPVLVTIEAVSPREVHNKPSFVLEVLSESEKVVDDAVLSILDGSLLSVESSVPLTVVDSGFVDISVVLLGSKLIVVSKSIVPVDPSLLNSVDVCDTVKCIDNNKMKR